MAVQERRWSQEGKGESGYSSVNFNSKDIAGCIREKENNRSDQRLPLAAMHTTLSTIAITVAARLIGGFICAISIMLLLVQVMSMTVHTLHCMPALICMTATRKSGRRQRLEGKHEYQTKGYVLIIFDHKLNPDCHVYK
jgi:hypothetical protein